MNVPDLCRKHSVDQSTYYNWKAKYGGMEASDLTKIRELEAENTKLNTLLFSLVWALCWRMMRRE